MASPTRFRPLTSQLNASALGPVIQGQLTTTNNTATAIATFALPAGVSALFEVHIVGRRTDGANAGDSVSLKLNTLYSNLSGTATIVGSDTASVEHANTSVNASAASSSATGAVVSILVAGVTGATIDWTILSGVCIPTQ